MKSIILQLLALSCLTQAVKAGGPELVAVYLNKDTRTNTTYVNTTAGVRAVKSKTTTTDYTVEKDWSSSVGRIRFFTENGQKYYEIQSPLDSVDGTVLARPYETVWSPTHPVTGKADILRANAKRGNLGGGIAGWEHWNARGTAVPMVFKLPNGDGTFYNFTSHYAPSFKGSGLRFETPNGDRARGTAPVQGYAVSNISLKTTLDKKLTQTFAISMDPTANRQREPWRSIYLLTNYLISKGYSYRSSTGAL
jgi:hypothetical protein